MPRAASLIPTFVLLAASLAAAPIPATPTPVPAAAPKSPADPTLITLHYKNAPATDVFKDLFSQIGRDYLTYSNPNNLPMSNSAPADWPALSIDADAQPYWKVIITLNDILGTTTTLRRNGKIAINRPGNNAESGVRCFSGPCLLIARDITHNANFNDPDHLDDCVINVTLLTEPNLSVATYSGRVNPDLAIDERGMSLVPPSAPPPPPTNLPVGMGQNGIEADTKPVKLDTYSLFQIVLNVPSTAGSRIAQVKGNAHLKLIEKSTVIDIPAAEFASPRTIDFHGATVTVSAITTANNGANQEFRVSINITHPGITDDEWAKVNDLLDAASISIVDDKDFPLFTVGGGGGGGRASTNRIISSTFRQDEGFNNASNRAGPPAKCRITLPDTLRDLPIPFEFKNLPLP